MPLRTDCITCVTLAAGTAGAVPVAPAHATVPRAPQPNAARPDARIPAFARHRLPFRTLRLLGATCPLCEGLGCDACEQTGLG